MSQSSRLKLFNHRLFRNFASVILLYLAVSPASSQQPGNAPAIKALPAAPAPPEAMAQLEREIGQKVPRPTPRASVAELIDGISKRPGQAQRVDAARRGDRPGGVQTRATFSLTIYSEQPQPFSVTLSPAVTDPKFGSHAGLRLADGSAYAYFLGSLVYWDFPNNDSVRLWRGSFYGHSSSNPLVYFHVKVPSEGWYTINVNANSYGNVQLKRGNELLEDIPRVSGWHDYSSLQYLQAGSHYLQFVMPGAGYVSRLTVDCYKC